MVEGARLERVYTSNSIVSSNLTLSAIIFCDLSCFKNFPKSAFPRSGTTNFLIISRSYYINFHRLIFNHKRNLIKRDHPNSTQWVTARKFNKIHGPMIGDFFRC